MVDVMLIEPSFQRSLLGLCKRYNMWGMGRKGLGGQAGAGGRGILLFCKKVGKKLLGWV